MPFFMDACSYELVLMNETCTICEKRPARRRCPGTKSTGRLAGVPATPVVAICPACCGREREISIDCPLDCDYLREARRHEHFGLANFEAKEYESIPHREIEVSQRFLREHEVELMGIGQALAEVMIAKRSVDAEAAAAVESLIQAYKTSQSGLIYEAPPEDPAAETIRAHVKQRIGFLREQIPAEIGADAPADVRAHFGAGFLNDEIVTKVLIFLQRLILQHSNGRRRGRRFFEFLLAYFAAPPENEPQPKTGAFTQE